MSLVFGEVIIRLQVEDKISLVQIAFPESQARLLSPHQSAGAWRRCCAAARLT
jgi:hypothetical protein